MSACVRDHLHSLGIGILVMVLMMGIGGAMVMLSWAASTGIQISASNCHGQLMAACYVDLVKEDARLPVER